MNPTLLAYLGSVVVLLILIWAALEMRSRFVRMRRRKLENAWIKLDSTFVDTKQEESLSSPGEESEDQEEKPGQDFHARAQQNGHYSESKKLL